VGEKPLSDGNPALAAAEQEGRAALFITAELALGDFAQEGCQSVEVIGVDCLLHLLFHLLN
jgi:hypothetical protein